MKKKISKNDISRAERMIEGKEGISVGFLLNITEKLLRERTMKEGEKILCNQVFVQGNKGEDYICLTKIDDYTAILDVGYCNTQILHHVIPTEFLTSSMFNDMIKIKSDTDDKIMKLAKECISYEDTDFNEKIRARIKKIY